MWKLVVSGRADMTPEASPEAQRQLLIRYRNGAMLVDSLVAEGFTTVHADVIFGDDLDDYVSSWVKSRPLRVVVLAPSSASVLEREIGRGTTAYHRWAI